MVWIDKANIQWHEDGEAVTGSRDRILYNADPAHSSIGRSLDSIFDNIKHVKDIIDPTGNDASPVSTRNVNQSIAGLKTFNEILTLIQSISIGTESGVKGEINAHIRSGNTSNRVQQGTAVEGGTNVHYIAYNGNWDIATGVWSTTGDGANIMGIYWTREQCGLFTAAQGDTFINSVMYASSNGQLVIASQITNGFLSGTDTPNTFSGDSLKIVRVRADETGLEFVNNPPPSFVALSDTPADYANTLNRFDLSDVVTNVQADIGTFNPSHMFDTSALTFWDLGFESALSIRTCTWEFSRAVLLKQYILNTTGPGGVWASQEVELSLFGSNDTSTGYILINVLTITGAIDVANNLLDNNTAYKFYKLMTKSTTSGFIHIYRFNLLASAANFNVKVNTIGTGVHFEKPGLPDSFTNDDRYHTKANLAAAGGLAPVHKDNIVGDFNQTFLFDYPPFHKLWLWATKTNNWLTFTSADLGIPSGTTPILKFYGSSHVGEWSASYGFVYLRRNLTAVLSSNIAPYLAEHQELIYGSYDSDEEDSHTGASLSQCLGIAAAHGGNNTNAPFYFLVSGNHNIYMTVVGYVKASFV